MVNQERRPRRHHTKSCEQCRRRKVRCDRNIPCGPCARSRSSLGCSYRRSDTPQRATSASVPLSTSNLEDVAPQSQGVFSAARPHPTIPHPHPNPHPPSPPLTSSVSHGRTPGGNPESGAFFQQSQHESVIADLHHRLQRLEDQLSASDPGSNQALHDVTGRIQEMEKALAASLRPDENANDGSGLSIAQLPPRLHGSANKLKLLGPTHWIHKVDQLQAVRPFNVNESEPSFRDLKTDLGRLVKECRSLRRTIKSQQSVILADPVPNLRDSLPSRPICDELVQCYLRTFELIYRVIHIPTFWKEYEQFWDQSHPATGTSSSTAFLMKLVLILAIGAAFFPRRGAFTEDEFLHPIQTWIYAAQWWLVGPAEKSTFNLDGLQVLCLLLSARKTSVVGASSWLSSGSLLEMALQMGLHRDPTSIPSLSVFQTEMRVRLWTTVLELSLQSSLDSTASTLPYPCFDNVRRKPLNINDEDISPDSTVTPRPKPMHVFTESSIQILFSESAATRAAAIQFIYNHPTQSYPKALELSDQLRTCCQQLASFFSSSSQTVVVSTQSTLTSPITPLRPTDFHHKFLDMNLRRYILDLHTPFMVQARKYPQYYYSRKICLEVALAIASYIDLTPLASSSSSPTPDHSHSELDDLSRLTLVGRGSFNVALGLNVISVLGLEIVTQLEEESISSDSLGTAAPPISSPASTAAAATAPTTTTGSSNRNPNPDFLAELARTHRAPLLRCLERIQDQLKYLLVLGSPSTKRYNIVAALLGQIRAMETGKCVKRVLYETIRDSLRLCSVWMGENSNNTSVAGAGMSSAESVDARDVRMDPTMVASNVNADTTTTTGNMNAAVSDEEAMLNGIAMDEGIMDPLLNLDLSSLLYMPNFPDANNPRF